MEMLFYSQFIFVCGLLFIEAFEMWQFSFKFIFNDYDVHSFIPLTSRVSIHSLKCNIEQGKKTMANNR